MYTWCWRWRSVFFSLPRLRSSRSSVFSSKLLCLFVILLLVFPSVSCSFFSLASSSGFLKCSVYSSRWSRFVMSAFCFSLLCVRPPPFLFFCLLLCFPFSLCFFPSLSRSPSVFFLLLPGSSLFFFFLFPGAAGGEAVAWGRRRWWSW